jgi:hypothetical protein
LALTQDGSRTLEERMEIAEALSALEFWEEFTK